MGLGGVLLGLSLLVAGVQAVGTWTPETNLPSAIQEVSVTAINGQVYAVGGSLNEVRSNETRVFDPTTRVWISKAAYPGTARDHMGIVGVGSLLYLIGGITANPQPSVTTVQRYDPSTNSWTALAPLPAARGAMGVAALNGKIYAAGGIRGGVAVNDFAVFDPASNAWTPLPALPTPRDHLTAAAVNGKIYALGGRNTGVCAPLKTVEVYDPATNAWSTGTPMIAAHAGHASGVANNHIQVFGGEGNATDCGVIATAEDFDPATNAWTALPNMPTPRAGSGGATVGSSVYIPGGAIASGSSATSVHERFDAAAASSLPSPWTSQDVGAVGAPGGASYANGTFTVQGAGADIWGTADAFQFVSQPLAGDGQVTARIVGLQNTNTYAKAGVMIRQALTAGSAHVLLDLKGGGGLEFLTRPTSGGQTTFLAGANGGGPVWVRLTRSGSSITAYSSTDGQAWTSIGTASGSFTGGAYVGLAVTSHVAGVLTTATIDSVTVSAGGSPGVPPTVSLTSPANGSAYQAPATVPMAATASDSDGSVSRVDFYANNALVGSSTSNPYTFNWTNVPAGSYALTATASDNTGLQTTSAAINITVNGTTGGTLPSPWQQQDVGSTGAAGSATVSNGAYSVLGAGADIWGTADAFHYVYQPLSGDGQITARVTGLQNTNSFAKAGVMIRETLSAGSAHAILDLKASGGVEFLARTGTGGSTAFVAGASNLAPVWVRLARTGTTITASLSSDGTTWTPLATTTMAMASSVYVGLAVCSHVTGTTTTGTFDNVAVGAVSGGGGGAAAPGPCRARGATRTSAPSVWGAARPIRPVSSRSRGRAPTSGAR